MKSFSVKCITKEEAYSFGRLMFRLGLRWLNGETFSANNTKWREYRELTHYNVDMQSSSNNRCATFGCLDDHIIYPIIKSDKFSSIRSLDDIDDILRVTQEE